MICYSGWSLGVPDDIHNRTIVSDAQAAFDIFRRFKNSPLNADSLLPDKVQFKDRYRKLKKYSCKQI